MKHLFTLFLVSAALLVGRTGHTQVIEQDLIHDFTDPQFSNQDSVSNEIKFILADTNQIIVAGQYYFTQHRQSIFLGAFDYSGNLLWQDFISLPPGSNIMELAAKTGLTRRSAGGYAVGGVFRANDFSDTSSHPFVIEFQPDGTLIHTALFEPFNVWKLDALIEYPLGDYFLTGITDKVSDYGQKIWIMDVNGNTGHNPLKVLSPTTGTNPWGELKAINNIFPLMIQGELKFGLNYTSFGDDISLKSYGFVFTGLDTGTNYTYSGIDFTDGWAPSTLGGYNNQPQMASIQQRGQNQYYFLGTALKDTGNPAGYFAPLLGWYYGQLNDSFQVIWNQTLTIPTNDTNFNFTTANGYQISAGINLVQEKPCLAEARDGDLLLLQNTGESALDSTGTKSYAHKVPLMMRTDAQGVPVWKKLLRHVPVEVFGIDESLQTISVAPNGLLVLAGSVSTDSIMPQYNLNKKGMTSWLLILNDSLNEGTPTGIGILPQPLAAKVLVYPNPATHQINLTYSELLVTRIDIFDIMGRRVRTFNPVSKSLPVGDLNRGAYFLKINTNHGILVKKVVLE